MTVKQDDLIGGIAEQVARDNRIIYVILICSRKAHGGLYTCYILEFAYQYMIRYSLSNA